MSWEEQLKQRVPSFLHGDNNLSRYLEVCGEAFDELVGTIKQHDIYKDYKQVPEKRLGLLAERFALNPPAELPQEIMRGILRDISTIHKTRGVEASLIWVFRILSWEVNLRYAWLPNPERYDPNIKEIYPNFYLGEGFEDDSALEDTYIIKFGDPYEIGDKAVLFHQDNNFAFKTNLHFGRNDLAFIGIGDAYDPYTPQIDFIPSTDINKIDYRNFLYGKAGTNTRGTYFYGRGFFDTYDTATDLRIIGEEYDEGKVIRKEPKVLSTPYIVVEVSGQDFEQFAKPYIGSDGTTYTYTSKETYNIAETLINYMLHEFTRPSHVKILMIITKYRHDDEMLFGDELIEKFDAEPQGFQERLTPLTTELYTVNVDEPPKMGDEYLVIGAPSVQLSNSLLGIPAYKIGDSAYSGEFIISKEPFNYTDTDIEFTQEGSKYVSRSYQLRTPSELTVKTPLSESINIEGKSTINSEWVTLKTSVNGEETFSSYDVNYIRLSSGFEPTDGFEIDVNWKDQTTLTKTPQNMELENVA